MRRRETRIQGSFFGSWMPAEGEASGRLVLAQSGMKATRRTICYQTTISITQHRLVDKMKLPKLSKFLHLPKSLRRNRSKARSEIGPIEGQNEAEPAAPRPTESTPDLRTGTSDLLTPRPLTPRGQESNGM